MITMELLLDCFPAVVVHEFAGARPQQIVEKCLTQPSGASIIDLS
jgi:hypothetical protein